MFSGISLALDFKPVFIGFHMDINCRLLKPTKNLKLLAFRPFKSTDIRHIYGPFENIQHLRNRRQIILFVEIHAFKINSSGQRLEICALSFHIPVHMPALPV